MEQRATAGRLRTAVLVSRSAGVLTRSGCERQEGVQINCTRWFAGERAAAGTAALRQTRTRHYIEANPVKVFLVREAKDWPRSSARRRDDYGRLCL